MGVPRLIFGAASFGMNFVNPEDAQEVLNYLKENNITHLDTAGRYPPTSPGRSEELLDHRGELEKSAIEKSINTSLQRMGVEQVNTLHIHWPDPETPLKDQAETLDSLHKTGKFKNLGVSNFQPDLLQEFLDICEANGYVKPTIYQGDYSAVNRGMEKKLLPILKKYGIAYNAFRVLASGFLSGKLTNGNPEGTRFDGEGPMNKFMQNLYNQESLHNALKELEETTGTLGITTIDAALRWAYYHSSLDTNNGIILGASSLTQIKSNIESISQGPLPQECLNTFELIWEKLEPKCQPPPSSTFLYFQPFVTAKAGVDTGLKNGLADEDFLPAAQPLVPLLQQPVGNQYHDLGCMQTLALFCGGYH
ncbi:uncharacterized protein ATNIH1004_009488 [Aspergillus tanneri]|uniref:D-xylose reductase [NAD(P)H] n=1 Tax=Aspergillus tanneri TaxID=1220188 RepID=A0A5M9MAP2_9EURO|nr:uncharacterized protein ATNIH1004_009488 [Aspergillus tanneri]KAA8642736.1 hypothetical protein ATNIH1004_009488 [Aspergillus tanneri]